MKKNIIFLCLFACFSTHASKDYLSIDSCNSSDICIESACDDNNLTTEEERNLFSIIFRSLRFMAKSVAGTIVSEYVKNNILNWSTEASEYYHYSPGVRTHVNHIAEEWQYTKCPREARKHVRNCSICRNAARDIGL